MAHFSREGWQYFCRAMHLRCPTCGERPIFLPLQRTRSLSDWFTPLDGCPRCGYPYEREPGYYLMSIWAVNYGAGSALGLLLYGVLEWFFDLPLEVLLACVMIPIVLFNFFFARHSKALFLAFDLYCDPHEREGGDGGGNVRLPPTFPMAPAPVGSAPPRDPVEAPKSGAPVACSE